MQRKIKFTHLWVGGFGWETTIYLQSDFTKVEELGYNDVDGQIFIAISDKGGRQIIKGYYDN